MAPTKGFTIFARAWKATSPPPCTYKMHDPLTRIPSPPISDDEQSIDASRCANGVDVEVSSDTSTARTTAETADSPARFETSSAASSSSTTVSSPPLELPSAVSSTTTVSSTPSDLPSAASSTTTGSSPPSEPSKPRSRQRVDFAKLQSIFATESATDSTDPTPSPSLSSLWYILTTALLLAFHKEKLIADLWTYLAVNVARASGTNDDDDDHNLLTTARHIREASLKASTLVGFPRAINALLTLHRAIQSSHPALSTVLQGDSSLRSSPWLSPADKFNRGMALFQTIYDKHTARVVSTMSSCSGGDLTHFAIQCIYGELLAENAIIGDLGTGMLEFVCCLADGVAPQAKGHFFGSVNLGATRGQLRGAVLMAQELARQVRVPCAWDGGPEEERDEGEEEEEEDMDEWKFLQRVTIEETTVEETTVEETTVEETTVEETTVEETTVEETTVEETTVEETTVEETTVEETTVEETTVEETTVEETTA
ncbi:hypothetical protein CLCR_02888 [Cladophialophora carrionii]|uniref:Uncharacterized protein n=1 Tax=Cladophialophora carrionii TaxID=86049 RepID=A0A1C1D2I2_9EURO|nr:hypothetical protein CLCR_02888 [Cladophialophora carrionii]